MFAGLLGILFSYPVHAAETITVKGSDTMVILGQRLAEEYMKTNKDVSIQVTGGGSGTGIAALLNKTTNLANSSRPIKDSEAKKAREMGIEITEIMNKSGTANIPLHGTSISTLPAN